VKAPADSVYLHPDEISFKRIKQAEEMGLDSVEKRDFLIGLDSTSEFYMSSTEVTNVNWKEFLMYLKQEGRT